MADIQQLERALVKADSAGDEEAARAFAAEIRKLRSGKVAAPARVVEPMPPTEAPILFDDGGPTFQDRKDASRKAGRSAADAAVAGAALGISDIGNVALKGAAKVLPMLPQQRRWLEQANRTRQADFDALGVQNADQPAFGVMRTAGNVATTLPIGGILGQTVGRATPALVRMGVSEPVARGFANSLATGGFRAGEGLGVGANTLLRFAGGAATGAASAGAISPKDAMMGGVIGGVLPVGVKAAASTAGWAGRSLNSLAQPFTENGQRAIAGKIVRNFAQGGPTAINAAELVPGSIPTLAEATGNAGLATLQRGARDLRPNAFAAREEANAAARNALFDEVAGDAGKIDFFRQSRSQAAKQLYDDALTADTSANVTPYIKGQITQLLKRPSINDARKQAQQWAIERGEKATFGANMKGLHDMKLALDDEISVATRAGKGGQVKALEATQAKLLDVMEKLSPAYKDARLTYASMSKPVNAMEALQGLKLTDAKGNITLQKVKSAIENLERSQNGAGISAAKSIEAAQMQALKAIQADLLRQTALGAGRSAGSNTFQNIATDNILNTFLPGKLGQAVGGKVGGILGQAGKLAYSGPNEAIRNKLADMMLDPALAQSAFQPANPLLGPAGQRFNALLEAYGPAAYRAAPVLSSDR